MTNLRDVTEEMVETVNKAPIKKKRAPLFTSVDKLVAALRGEADTRPVVSWTRHTHCSVTRSRASGGQSMTSSCG